MYIGHEIRYEIFKGWLWGEGRQLRGGEDIWRIYCAHTNVRPYEKYSYVAQCHVK